MIYAPRETALGYMNADLFIVDPSVYGLKVRSMLNFINKPFNCIVPTVVNGFLEVSFARKNM